MSGLHNNQAEKVWLAPMSGSTDAAFRRQAVRFGAPAVVSEMVAGEALAAARPDMVRRTCRHEGRGRWIVQLAARRPEDMEAGARLLAEAGVDQIDINMGCPSRQVTGGSSGSALMKEPALARSIISAAIAGSGGLPVSLKMRLGWDDQMLNAPEIAQFAEAAGVCMITVHGRTRCQFYKGRADWSRIRETVEAVSIPVIANGDIVDEATADSALQSSSAYGVMVGRAAMGAPWLPAQVAAFLDGNAFSMPDLETQFDSLMEQIADSQELYGEKLGLRIVRKHIAATIEKLPHDWSADECRASRAAACQISDAVHLREFLSRVYFAPVRAAA